jgi:hypothetical protein
MFALASRAAIAVALTIAGGALFAGSAAPAMALCKYGTPHCVDPHRPLPEVKVPDDNGWVDPDCKYYGNCLSPNSARAATTAGGKPQPVLKLQSKKLK